MSFNQIHGCDGGAIGYKKYCKTCNNETPSNEIQKAYEITKGNKVVFTEGEIDAFHAQKGIRILTTEENTQINPLFIKQIYLLNAENKAEKPFVLLREALKASGKRLLTKCVVSNREQLAYIHADENGLFLTMLYYPEEIADVATAKQAKAILTPKEAELAMTLLDSLMQEVVSIEFEDGKNKLLEEMVEKKLSANQ